MTRFRRRPRHGWTIALALAVLGCQAPPPARPGASKAPAVKSSTQPAKLVLPSLLHSPTSDTVAMSGKVSLEASYAASHARGTLVSNAGGTLVLMDGGQLVSNAGGTLVSNAGGTLVSNAGGTLVSNAGGTLVSNAGGTLVSNAGGTLVSNAGGTLVSNAGGTIVAREGGNVVVPADLLGEHGPALIASDGASLDAGPAHRHLLAEQGSQAAFGESRPAVGMWVGAVDTTTGFTVPLGTDDAGSPVYAVYSDLAGAFTLHVPADVADHVRVVARAPGIHDARLVLTSLSRGGPAQLDENHANVAGYVRSFVRRRLLAYLSLGTDAPASPDPTTTLIVGAFSELAAAVHELGLDRPEDPRSTELGLLLADVLVEHAHLDQATMMVPPSPDDLASAASPGLAGQNAFDALADVFGRVNRAAAVQAEAGGVEAGRAAAFFAGQPYLVAANLGKAPADRFRIEKAADMSNFLVDAYFSKPDPIQADMGFDVMVELGVPAGDRDRLLMAAVGILTRTLQTLLDDQTVRSNMLDVIHGAGKALAQAPVATPSAAPAEPLPTPPDFGDGWRVDTLAGGPDRHGEEDAMGSAAGLGHGPRGLAVDDSVTPPLLYVAESNGAVRVVKVGEDAAHSDVSTLLPPSDERNGLAGLVLDGQGHLFAASDLRHQVFRIALQAPHEVVAIAGDGHAGFADGPGSAAELDEPSGLAFVPADGTAGRLLVVADRGNERIRLIALDAPGYPTSTLMGDGKQPRVEAPLAPPAGEAAARLDLPTGAAYDAQRKRLYVLNSAKQGEVSLVLDPFLPNAFSRLLVGGGAEQPGGYQHDGIYNAALMSVPLGIAVRPQDGWLVVSSNQDDRLHLIDPGSRWVKSIVGGGEHKVGGYADGDGASARFKEPQGVAVGRDGTIYVADTGNLAIRRVRR